MRKKTNRRLRVAAVLVVAVLVAVMAGSAVALATDGTGTPGEKCWKDQFIGVNQENGAGSTSVTYDVWGNSVTVHFSWTADKHLTAWTTGGYFSYLLMKAGSTSQTYGPGDGPYELFVPNANNIGNALSHMNFCLVANVATTGSLRITKTITGDNPSGWTAEHFGVTVTGPNGYSHHAYFNSSGYILLEDLEPGSYSIVEDDPGYPFSAQSTGPVSVTAGNEASASITNNGTTSTTVTLPGSLRITKTITGDNPDELEYDDFSVTITGPNGYYWQGTFDENGEIVLTNLTPGTYVIDETDPSYPFSVSGEGNVEVVTNRETGTTIVNTGRTTTTLVLPGALRITKEIAGDNPEGLDWEDFFVTITGPNDFYWFGSFDESGEIYLDNLAPGEYDIDEDGPAYPFEAQGEGPVQVVTDKETGTTIVNTGSTSTTLAGSGSLKITKAIEGDNPGGLTYEDFEVVVTGPSPSSNVVFNGAFDANGEIVITGLLPGTYTVTEKVLGYPWKIEGDGPIEVTVGQEALQEIVNTGITTTSTTLSRVTTTAGGSTSTTLSRVTTTAGGGTTSTTVFGYRTSVSDTVMGWVAGPDAIHTGGGGMAGGNTGALVALILASTMLGLVLAASAVGVRHGVL